MEQTIKDRLLDLRLKILQQHKIMLEFERRDFEAIFGAVNAGELLQLLIDHAQFAWLRRMSDLIVLIDETAADKEFPMTDQNAEDFIAQAKALFDKENPRNPINRRISIIVMNREAEDRFHAGTPDQGSGAATSDAASSTEPSTPDPDAKPAGNGKASPVSIAPQITPSLQAKN